MYTAGKHQFIFGGDLHYVAGANRLLVENTPFDGASSSHTEQKQAAYVTYAYGNDFLSLSGGLRYEHLLAEMKDKFDSTKDRTRHFNNFFPSINLRYSSGECSHAFAYSVKTTRPNYYVLNTNVYYTNRFNYTIGNPAINPAIRHTLSYSFMYKFVYFNLLYANMKNYIGHTFYADAEHPTVIVTSYANYDRFQQLAAVFNLQYQLSFWQPAFMFYFLKPFFYVDYLGEKVKNNRPVVNILYNNSFELPWKITLNMEYPYTSRCNYLMFKLEPTHQINLGVQQAFLNDHLQVILKADDLFRGNSNNYTGKINTITFDHSEHPDSRKFSIHLIYRFNNYEKKVSQNAVTEELQRLP